MRKIFLAVIMMAALAVAANAQKGSILLYGNLSLATTDDGGNKTTEFGISPGIGYQFSSNWTAGVNLGYNTQSMKPPRDSRLPALNTFSAGPFVRYTYPLSNIFSVYGQFNADYTSITKTGTPSVTGVDAKVFPAIAANLKKGFALNFSFGNLGFAISKTSGVSNSNNSFNLAFGSGASFGISKNFGCKAKSKVK